MIDSAVFFGAAIVAVTFVIKDVAPKVKGWVTVVAAALLGLVLALVDTHIGVMDITVAQGLMLGLAASGVHQVARQVG